RVAPAAVAAQRVEGLRFFPPARAGHVHAPRQSGHGIAGPRPADRDRVGAVGTVDDDAVGRAVAGAAARRGREVDVDRGDVGAARLAEGGVVDGARGGGVGGVDDGGVHDAVGAFAGGRQPYAVG